MKSFTTITNFGFYQNLLDDSIVGSTEWTINKSAKPGDLVYLYVCQPKGAIVATAVIADLPYLDEDLNSVFFGHWFASMENLRMLDISISRPQLRQLFPDWGYWKQPRNNIEIPAQYCGLMEKITKC